MRKDKSRRNATGINQYSYQGQVDFDGYQIAIGNTLVVITLLIVKFR